MNAKDIMTRDIITVTPNMSVKKLAMLLIKSQISGAPVSGKNGRSSASSPKPISSRRRAET